MTKNNSISDFEQLKQHLTSNDTFVHYDVDKLWLVTNNVSNVGVKH